MTLPVTFWGWVLLCLAAGFITLTARHDITVALGVVMTIVTGSVGAWVILSEHRARRR